MDRQREIAAKKAKIAELRRLREERQRNHSTENVQSTAESAEPKLRQVSTGNPQVGLELEPESVEEIVSSEDSPATAVRLKAVSEPAKNLSLVSAQLIQIHPLLRISSVVQTEAKVSSAHDASLDEQTSIARKERESSPEQPKWRYIDPPDHQKFIKFVEEARHAVSRLAQGAEPFPSWCEASRLQPKQHDRVDIGELSVRRSLIPNTEADFPTDEIARGAVASLDWCPDHQILAVSRIGARCIEIWDMESPVVLKEPEWTLSSSSIVTGLFFNREGKLAVHAATAGGQIFMWDLSLGRESLAPSARSLSGENAHCAPLVALVYMGGILAPSLLSLDSDGLALFWSIDVLAHPVESIRLQNVHKMSSATVSAQPDTKSRPINPTCATVVPEDEGSFVVGSMTGEIYRCRRADRLGGNSGIDQSVAQFPLPLVPAPISHLVFREPDRSRANNCDGLILASGGLDWSVKIWHVYSRISAQSTITPYMIRQIWCDDVVADIAWCPGCASLLAIAAGSVVSLWDILKSCDTPVCRIELQCAATKVCWSPELKLAVGKVDGVVDVLTVSEELLARAQAPALWADSFKKFSA